MYKTYKKIGDSLAGRHKQFFVLFLLVFVTLIVLSYCFRINASSDVLYWTLSSVIQSLLALTALMVVGSIFKLQILHSREEKITDEVQRNPDFIYHTGRLNEALSSSDILEEMGKIRNKGTKVRSLEEIRSKLEGVLRSKESTKSFTIKFAIYNSFVVGLSLIFLVLTPLIANYHLGVPSLYLIVLLFIYSLFLVIKGITASLWQ